MEFQIGEKTVGTEIEVGDVFVSKDEQIYVYKEDGGTHRLQNVFTVGQFVRGEGSGYFESAVKKHIKEKKLTHYPKKHYKMQINFIPK